MKKLVVLGLAAVMALGAPFSVCAAEEETTVEHPSGLKIGCAVQTMSNQVWAQQMEEITKDAKEDGNEVTVVECKENANTQIDQIENFITSGMDVIIVQPVDPDAIEEVCKEALDSDIEVVCWDEKMENSSFNWVIENYDLGVEIGTQAADFINEKFGDKGCEVVVLGYPQTPILLERENGILDALKEKAPNAEVVANQPAIDTTEGLNAMETILQAHPDVKVVCCIGGGGATGANEALKGTYGSEVPDDIGIGSCHGHPHLEDQFVHGQVRKIALQPDKGGRHPDCHQKQEDRHLFCTFQFSLFHCFSPRIRIHGSRRNRHPPYFQWNESPHNRCSHR